MNCVPLGSVWKGKVIPKETELMRIRARKKELKAQLEGVDVDAGNPCVVLAPVWQRLAVADAISWAPLGAGMGSSAKRTVTRSRAMRRVREACRR